MGADRAESTRASSVEKRNQDDKPMRERWTGEYDDMEENISDDSGKHRDKDKRKSSVRREEKEHRSRDRERLKAFDGVKEREKENKDSDRDRISSRDRRKEDREEREKDKVREKDREKYREKEKDRERKDRLKEKDLERGREKELEDSERRREKERIQEKSRDKSRDKDEDREMERGKTKDREREKNKDRERNRENSKHRGKDAPEREKVKERSKEKQADQEKDRARDRDRSSHRQKDESHDTRKDMEKGGHSRFENDYSRHNQSIKERLENSDDENVSYRKQEKAEVAAFGYRQSATELEERISRIREERLKSSEGASEVLAWVSKSRKLEEKRNTQKEKSLQLSKVYEEQDNVDEDSDDEAANQHITHDLGGVKILHGIDKVLEGGAVVLTLKDQSILADGDINQEVDMLENVEIGEQKRRNEAYKAAKKRTGVYDDKFSYELGAEKKMLPQYDDPVADEGVTLDSSGRFTSESERKLEELRKRIQGVSASAQGEDLNSIGKISSDYYTQEEMTKFKKPKKKKSFRKKEKLDLDALEAEAISAGLGSEDLGSRNGGRRQNLREEQERIEAEKRASAYQSAYAKAEEASKALRQGQVPVMQAEDETPVFGDDDEELRKSLERARKIALKKRDEGENTGPEVTTLLSFSTANDSTEDNSDLGSGDQAENKVVFTEMEEFVWGLQLDGEERNPEDEDVFMEEDVAPISISTQEMKDEDGGWSNVNGTMEDETSVGKEEEKVVVPDETIHEAAIGKGIGGALKLLKDRGMLKEPVEWGGRTMDKKKSKLVGIYDNDAAKEIRIERTDEYGRILAPKEAFRQLSHSFHGKRPGKTKIEKRMRQYQEELKVKQMENADTPSSSVQRMREAQAKLQTPYLVISGNVRPGQSSDPSSGFATVEKDFAGGLTPMLGDKKVEHFLNIKRKSDSKDDASRKKPKT